MTMHIDDLETLFDASVERQMKRRREIRTGRILDPIEKWMVEHGRHTTDEPDLVKGRPCQITSEGMIIITRF